MKNLKLTLALLTGLAVASATTAFAADKEVTLTGTACCGKCTLKVTEKCSTMLKATMEGKEVTYQLTGKEAKLFHEKVCSGPGIKVTVTGTVTEKDGKEMLKATKIEEVK